MAIALVSAGCYDAPKPPCGFRCGPAAACPDGYTCGSDNRCRAENAPSDLACATVDAGVDAYSPSARLVNPLEGVLLDPNDAIQVAFDVPVDNVTQATFRVLFTGSTQELSGSVGGDVSRRNWVFVPVSAFPASTGLTVDLDSAINDPATGRNLRPTRFEIMTSGDTSAPFVVMITPVEAATGVSVGTNVAVRFSETVSGVSTASFTLTQNGTPVAGAVTYDPSASLAVFDPIDQLAPNTTYEPRLSSAIVDQAAIPLMNAPVLSSFTTGADTLAPTLRTTSPLDGANGVAASANVVVVFDEPVMNVSTTSFQLNGGAISGTVTMSNGNRTATFDPDANLPAAATITVTLSTAITDTSGNAAFATTFSFTTS